MGRKFTKYGTFTVEKSHTRFTTSRPSHTKRKMGGLQCCSPGCFSMPRKLAIWILTGSIMLLVATTFFLNIGDQGYKSCILPGGLSTFRRNNGNAGMIIIGIFLHIPLVVFTILLFISSFTRAKILGNSKVFSMETALCFFILGCIGIAGAIMQPIMFQTNGCSVTGYAAAKHHAFQILGIDFVGLTFGNVMWWFFMIIYVWCVVIGCGGVGLTDKPLCVPVAVVYVHAGDAQTATV